MDVSKQGGPGCDAEPPKAETTPAGAGAGGAKLRYSTEWAQGKRAAGVTPAKPKVPAADAAFVRAENEDDDGYDPYSDRRPSAGPLFERDPWD